MEHETVVLKTFRSHSNSVLGNHRVFDQNENEWLDWIEFGTKIFGFTLGIDAQQYTCWQIIKHLPNDWKTCIGLVGWGWLAVWLLGRKHGLWWWLTGVTH